MSKRINRAKLKAMGETKLRAACIVHATKAIEFIEAGEHAKADKHCALLDQCASVGREITGHRQFIDMDARTLMAQIPIRRKV